MYRAIVMAMALIVCSRAMSAELKPLQPQQTLTAAVLVVDGQVFELGQVSIIATRTGTLIVAGSVPGPGPAPPPGPGPSPSPQPKPAPGPAMPFRDAVTAAFGLVGAAGKSEAGAVAAVYSGVAGEAEAGSGWTVKRMVDEAKSRNASAISVAALSAWKPFWPALAKALGALGLEDSDVEKAVAAFRDVATVLGGA